MTVVIGQFQVQVGILTVSISFGDFLRFVYVCVPSERVHNLEMTSYYVASTSVRRRFDVMYLLGLCRLLHGKYKQRSAVTAFRKI